MEWTMRVRYMMVAGALVAISGCGEALPRTNPTEAIGGSMLSAQQAAAEARRSAEEAAAESEKSRRMLDEARSLYARSQSALRSCEAAAKAASRAKVRTVACPKAAKAEEVPTPVPAAVAAPAVTPEPRAAGVEPEYSPSDAPEGYFQQGKGVAKPAPAPELPQGRR